MTEISYLGLSLLIIGAAIFGSLVGAFVVCLCVAAGDADERMGRE